MIVNKKGSACILLGILLIVISMGMMAYNLRTAETAGKNIEKASEQLIKAIPATPTELANVPEGEVVYSDHILNPNMDMPVHFLEGHNYIGIIEIPQLGVKLPVQEDWSYPDLKVSPCRYEGSVYLDNMVICGHSSKTHFRYIRTLKAGEAVIFTDTDGNRFEYKVRELEILKADDTERMVNGDWDLTLFTCTPGGVSRATLRCDRVSELAEFPETDMSESAAGAFDQENSEFTEAEMSEPEI